MVVDLAVDGEDNAVIGVGQGLGPAVDTHDAQTLMAQDCRASSVGFAHIFLPAALCGLYILVLLQVTLPPVEPGVVSFVLQKRNACVTQSLLQSGPLWRILQLQGQ